MNSFLVSCIRRDVGATDKSLVTPAILKLVSESVCWSASLLGVFSGVEHSTSSFVSGSVKGTCGVSLKQKAEKRISYCKLPTNQQSGLVVIWPLRKTLLGPKRQAIRFFFLQNKQQNLVFQIR